MDMMLKLVEDREMTLLVVTHDQEVAERCQRVVKLVGGRVEA